MRWLIVAMGMVVATVVFGFGWMILAEFRAPVLP